MKIWAREVKYGVGLFGVCLAAFVGATFTAKVYAQEPVCAIVKIEIQQELTLERQAFDAQMKINNALDDMPLDNVQVVVNFEDEDGNPVLASSDPNNAEALFFIRSPNLENITDVNGNGSVAPSTTAIANWLIIPTPGSAKDASGTVYFVGATLTYDLAGEAGSITVVPDRIVVKPLPRLSLDYFLQREVIADDAFTPEIEAPQPFTLGVRVSNNGQATAANVSIDSAQPEIIENDEGLAIGFEIINSFVGDQAVTASLLLNLGDVPANESKVGRWQMVTTLSGEFVKFSAEFTHADEFGGELTSLLEATNTHFLIHDVLVVLPGRDTILDFLADDGDALRVYESDTVDTPVNDASSTATLSFVQNVGLLQQYSLNVQTTPGFMYAKLAVTANLAASKVVNQVLRSDGTSIPLSNAWFSQERNESNGFDYFLNLFDVNSTGQYTVSFANKVAVPLAPVLQFIPDRELLEGQSLAFLVEATDPNGTIPQIALETLPVGATFVLDNTQNNVATYVFSWTPTPSIPGPGQAGIYDLNFIASDGVLSANRRANIVVQANNDSDGDGMDDQWEMDNFGTLDRDGAGDFDNDGVSDLDEYLNGTNPLAGPVSGPSVPAIVSPLFGSRVATLQPGLEIQNSTVLPSVPLQYEFELYADTAMTELVSAALVDEAAAPNTLWDVPTNLIENAVYTWRVRAYNGVLYSEWVNGEFRVDALAEAPGAFFINNPSDGAEVASFTPSLHINNSTDPDADTLVYVFKIFSDQSLSIPVLTSPEIVEQAGGVSTWQVSAPLQENTLYFWTVTATDADGLSAQSDIASFFVNTANEAPTDPTIWSPADTSVVEDASTVLHLRPSSDADNDSLLYEFELDVLDTFDSNSLLQSGLLADTQFSVHDLIENGIYFWRARASDGFATSRWVSASFRVNADNLAPPQPTLANPGDGSWVATLFPVFSVNAVTDPDGDEVGYEFEMQSVGLDEAAKSVLVQGVSWQPTAEEGGGLHDNTWYTWRARAYDLWRSQTEPSGPRAYGEWSAPAMFFVNDNNYDDAPVFTFVEPSTPVTVDSGSFQIRWNDTDPDSSAEIALYYDTDAVGEDGTLIVEALQEDGDGQNDHYIWDTSALTNGDYYVYAVIRDDASSATVYSATLITVNNATLNQPPTINLTSPASNVDITQGDVVTLTWTANDPDNNAAISLYYLDPLTNLGVLIAGGISEDYGENVYNWTVDLTYGAWSVYAEITDGTNPVTRSDAAGKIIVRTEVVGTSSDDVLRGENNSIWLVLDGGAGNDTLYGSRGDDVLIGGPDDDYLSGGQGNDVFIINLNDGNDTILGGFREEPPFDLNNVLRFGEGIAPPDIVLSIKPRGLSVSNLLITVTSSGQQIEVVKQYVSPQEILLGTGINFIEFANGTVWDRDQIQSLLQTINATDGNDMLHILAADSTTLHGGLGNDSLYGWIENDTLHGDEGNDVLSGDEGDDLLNGGAGNDTLWGYLGNDVLNGGAGDDELIGGYGDDVYLIELNQGYDRIDATDYLASNENRNDILKFGEGIASSDVVLHRDPNDIDDMLVTVLSSGQQIRVLNQFWVYGATGHHRYEIGFIEFFYGTIWDTTQFESVMRTLTASDGDDLLIAAGPSDASLNGGLGNDTLYGAGGNDTLNGGADNDFLFGGAGDDVYEIALNHGNDTINAFDSSIDDADRNDILRFGEGILPSDITLRVNNASQYHLLITINSTGQVITVENNYKTTEGDYRHQIAFIEFADDGTVWDSAQIESLLQTSIATDENDILIAVDAEGVTLEGGLGNDDLYGHDGDDVLIGGEGNDFLAGGPGADIYHIDLNQGNDRINARDDTIDGAGGKDIVRFGVGISPLDVSLVARPRPFGHLIIMINSTGQVVKVHRHFDLILQGYAFQIAAIEFADGTIWDKAQIESLLLTQIGTDDDDVLVGVGSEDLTLEGGAGNDRLYGSFGDDILIGGKGDDVLQGKEGADIYQVELNHGNDTINAFDDTVDEAGGKDIVRFGAGIVPSDVVLHRDPLYAQDMLATVLSSGQQIRIANQFWEYGNYLYQIGFIEFFDGTIWDTTQFESVMRTLTASDGDDLLIAAGPSDASLNGGLGNDTLYGAGGNDTLNGGADNDFLFGGAGDDVYEIALNHGNDTINAFDSSIDDADRNDILRFGEGIYPPDVSLSFDASDVATMLITVISTGQVITVLHHFSVSAGSHPYQLGFIEFANGTVWDRTTMAGLVN